MPECRICGEEKAEEEFAWRKKGVVRHKVCKACQRVYNHGYYAQNRDKEILGRFGSCANCHRRRHAAENDNFRLGF